MTREQRQALRESLIAQGFDRDHFTNDVEGTGEYTEVWGNGETTLAIAGGPRTP